MKQHTFFLFPLLLLAVFVFAACSEDEPEYDPYHDWQARNAEWFQFVTDSAVTAIAEAKAQWGDEWEEHCQWRRFKTLNQSADYDTHRATDSICVRIHKRGTGSYSPLMTDSVRISFRGWMMPATYRLYNEEGVLVDSVMQTVFSQTYYGEFNPETAMPQLSAITPFVQGFSTAIQYMVEDDDWYVYIPQQLAYGASANSAIPAYSTLLFRIHLAAVYPANSGVPDWK